MTDETDPDPDLSEMDPSEAERARRRDHDAAEEQRALLRPGMGKVFKQIQDAQRRVADELATKPARATKRRGKG